MDGKILDGKKIKNESDFHAAVSESLDFGHYYGRNLDALWDRLSTDVERPVHLIWLDSELSKKCLGEYFDKIIQIFEKARLQDLKFSRDEKFDYMLR